jgi:hypothetical protein
MTACLSDTFKGDTIALLLEDLGRPAGDVVGVTSIVVVGIDLAVGRAGGDGAVLGVDPVSWTPHLWVERSVHDAEKPSAVPVQGSSLAR